MKKTENSIYYNFSDFTINHYIDLIKGNYSGTKLSIS